MDFLPDSWHQSRQEQIDMGVTTEGDYSHRIYRHKASGREIETVGQEVSHGRLIVACQQPPAPLGFYETAEALDNDYELVGRYMKAYDVEGDD